MLINHPQTVAELEELYPLYEVALVSNDVETLTKMFWSAPEVMRFGVSENLYGVEELEAFRRGRPSVGLARTIKRRDIVTFGEDVGSITLEFEREGPEGKVIRGRQSQMWARMPEGWRIVAAHVSLLA
ncbi:oxalurate catabolism protein HpxZ [Granulicella sp. S190]|uniref:oxalurate catabolism protein HpxZ n=1 Tax=Granulicella sp. S190 TaxID=1747226 RepID=UPI0015768805|nr:oxalurate catabolism protein HpxZ [Granulicella sp. S190]